MEVKRETATTNTPHSHVPYGEAGSGLFSKKVVDTIKSIDELAQVVLESLTFIPVKPGSVFSIADYGCADGGSSMPLIHDCVKELRRLYGEELEICVQYEDQPVNDFKSLFCFLHGLIPGPRSYLAAFGNVFTSACGTSFFNQCFPSGSVHLGISNIALQWLSRKPGNLSDTVAPLLAKNHNEREAFRKQAENDLETFLLLRAKELSPGGKLAIAMLAQEDKEPSTKRKNFQIYKAMDRVLRNMAEEGIISQEELHETTFSEYYRSREELMKPFESEESPIRKAGLSIVSVEIKGVPVTYGTKTCDAKTIAKLLTEETRCWSNYTFISGLSDIRPPKEKSKIADEIYSRLENELAENASVQNEIEMVTSFMIIKKAIDIK